MLPKLRKEVATIHAAETAVQPDEPPASEVHRSYVKDQYPALVRNSRFRGDDLVRLRDEVSNFGYKPSVSILLPVYTPEQAYWERSLDSLVGQAYSEWELCICGDDSTEKPAREILDRYERLDERIRVAYLEGDANTCGLLRESLSMARGEFVGLLYCGDELARDALFEVVKLLQEHPGADLVYSDVDQVDESGYRSDPHFKPGWSPDLLLSTNYISQLSVYRRSLVEEIGGFREGFDGCQDYDLALRATERAGEIYHLPKVLYHRRADTGLYASSGDASQVRERARQALSEALKRRDLEGSVEDGLRSNHFRTKLKIKGEPRVSVIIPTRDNVSFLRRCIESVERLTAYANYELLIVDNDSRDAATLEYLASVPHRVIPFREAFNYSRINNFAVSQAEGEYVILLNDDTEVISGEWMHALLEHAQRPEVGAVGAKLLYPDGRIQHAGVVLGVGNPWGPGVALSSHQFYSSDTQGHGGIVATIANYSAVTAACMMIRKSLFEEVGGLDEENLRVQFNDVDLCLRIRERGFSIVYTPYAELYHHESVSRGYRRINIAENLYMREHWATEMDKDPFYNPHFSRGRGDFNLRADLLRPQVLRQDAEQVQEYPTGLVGFLGVLWKRKKLQEYRSYVRDRYTAARSSPRTALVSKPVSTVANTPHPKVANRRRYSSLISRLAGYSAAKLRAQKPLREEQLIWMFGSPRTGSTWLSRIMAELENQERWHEPYVGLLFGSFVYERLKDNDKLFKSPAFIMGEPYREVWLDSIKNFVLEGAAARYPELREDQYLVIKEPNGSIGAPLMMEATPESRMIFLIRDPRDVIASRLDALREGSWTEQDRRYGTEDELNEFTKYLADEYFRVVSQVQKSYDAHQGKKAFVRYEDLRYDPVNALKLMYLALGVEADRAQLEAAVAKHSWERIPESKKGSGKFYRSAQPGGWRRDLSSEQVKLIEDSTGPILSRYY